MPAQSCQTDPLAALEKLNLNHYLCLVARAGARLDLHQSPWIVRRAWHSQNFQALSPSGTVLAALYYVHGIHGAGLAVPNRV